MKSSKWCQICKLELTSTIHAQKHYYSSNHSKKFQQLRELAMKKVLVSPVKNAKSQCKICNLSVNGDVLASGHLDSEAHRRNSEVYCEICEVRTVSKEALLEHTTNSLSHLQKANIALGNPSEHTTKFKINCVPEVAANDSFSIPRVCVTPTLPSKQSTKKLSKADVQSSPPKKNIKNGENWQIFCSVCNIYYLSEQFYTHITEFPHVVLDILTNECSHEIVREFCSITDGKDLLCNLCNITMQGSSDAESHLNAAKHIKRFKAKFPERVSEGNESNIEDNKTSSTEKKVQDHSGKRTVKKSDDKVVKQALDVKDNIKPKGRPSHPYCYICRLDFESAIELNVHTVTFPHISMANCKSETVSLGVPYAEYWRQTKKSFFCTLCDFEIKSDAVSKSHMADSKHRTLLAEWCKEFESWKLTAIIDPKYFYCNVCNLSLLGTSEVLCHYDTEMHLKNQALRCKTSKPFKKIPLEKTNEDKENTLEEPIDEFDLSHKMDPEGHVVIKPPIGDLTYVSMESQLCQQVERLVHTLYYSKTLPSDVVLQYLKKINTEVAELDQKYDKNTMKATPVKKCNILKENSKNSAQIIHALDEKNNKEFKIQSFLLSKPTDEGVLKIPVQEKQNLDKLPDFSAGEQGPKIKDQLDQENEIIEHSTGKQEESESSLLAETNFLNMYLNIRKLRPATGHITERDILNQIKKLVKTINSTQAPPEKVLALLQNFNQDLDSAAAKFKIKKTNT